MNPSKALDEMELRLNTKLNVKETNNDLTVADINTINQNEKPFNQDAISLPPTKFELEREAEHQQVQEAKSAL